MKYSLVIVEELKREVEIEADSEQEAREIIKQKWLNEEIVLGADDFSNVEIY